MTLVFLTGAGLATFF